MEKCRDSVVIICGIDPGLDGAIMWLENGKVVCCVDMPTVTNLVNGKNQREHYPFKLNLLIDNAPRPDHVVLEKVSARGDKNEGSSSVFKFGRGYGLVEGIFVGKGYDVQLVTPQMWQKPFGVVGKEKDNKSSLKKARELWPDSDLFKYVKNNGRADAALIASYGALVLFPIK